MIKLVPFYKDIDPNGNHHKKLKRRIGKVDYRKNLQLLYDSFKIFNPSDNFLVLTDNTTPLPYECHRSDLSKFNIMESIVASNVDFAKKHLGKSVLIGADNIIVGSLNNFFDEDFDLGFYCIGERHQDEKFNVSNGVMLLNSTSANHDKIVDFFEKRYTIYKNYDANYKAWWGDMLSLNHLLSTKNIVEEFYNSQKTKKIYDFNGLKIKIFEINKDYVKWVDSNGNYKKSENDVILDFPGDQSIKQFMEIIFNDIKNKKIIYNI